MGKMLNKYIFLIACLLVSLEIVADPPSPVPPPESISIDGKLVVLFVVALLLGFYKIYILKVKKKRPI